MNIDNTKENKSYLKNFCKNIVKRNLQLQTGQYKQKIIKFIVSSVLTLLVSRVLVNYIKTTIFSYMNINNPILEIAFSL